MLVERFYALVTWQKNRLRTPEAWRLQAKVKAARGDHAGAEDLFSKAVSLAAALPVPFVHARTLLDWGLLCLARGRMERAQQLLLPALTIFRLLEAQPFVDAVERALEETNQPLDATASGGIPIIAG
jgi:tetratricopeptide (TPR) repeat protein